jgi:hypothetical protein
VRRRLLSLLLLSGTASVLSATTAFASPLNRSAGGSDTIGIRLVGAPGGSLDNPLASSYVLDRLAPGTSLTRTVEIDNDTSANADILVYPAAAGIVRGAFAYAASHSANQLTTWTRLSRTALRLAPHTETPDTITIQVPRNASSGERYAVVWAEIATSPPAAGGVTLVNRVGVRVYLSIGAGGLPPTNFAVGPLTTARSANGEPLVVATVRNTGQSTLEISGNLSLSEGPGGLRAGPFTAILPTILPPGVSGPAEVQLNTSLPGGPWDADLRLTSGQVTRSADATINLPRDVSAAKARSSGALSPLVPVVVVLFVLLVATAAALLVSQRKTTRRRVVVRGTQGSHE